MSELIHCSSCGEEITDDSDFCPHCGSLLKGEGIKCDRHPDVSASGVCIICRSTVCHSCMNRLRGRTFCVDHRSIEVQQDWANVFQSTEIAQAELVRSVLETAEFHVQLQNFSSIGYAWDGGGDSAQSRSNLSKPAKVFVPIPEYLEAARTVKDWTAAQ